MRHGTKHLLNFPLVRRWLAKCWRDGLAFGHELVEMVDEPTVTKDRLDDLLDDLVSDGWLDRGGNPSPSAAQVVFASITYGSKARGAYPTHFGYSPVRCPPFAEYVRA